MSNPQWFYADGAGVQRGPVAAAFLQAAFAQGQLRSDDLVWRDGMTNWTRHAEVAELHASAPPAMASPPYAPAYAAPPLMRDPARTPATQIAYAGFWRRYLALAIDNIIIWVPLMLVTFVLAWPGASSGAAPSPMMGLVYVGYWVAAPLYYALQESSVLQATFGKRALGIKVTDLQGRRLTFGNALGRWFAAALSYVTLYIGFLMAAFTERRQGLHDMVAGTLVVDRWAFTAHPERQKTGLSGGWVALLVIVLLGIPVLAILAAIAIPAYQDYSTRAKVAGVLSTTAATKVAIATFVAGQSRCPTNGEVGLDTPAGLAGQYVGSLAVGTLQSGNCGMEIAAGNTKNANVDGKRIWLEFHPGPQVSTWTCTSEIPDKYLPTECRG